MVLAEDAAAAVTPSITPAALHVTNDNASSLRPSRSLSDHLVQRLCIAEYDIGRSIYW